MHFKEYDWDDEIDHDWYEFSGMEEKNDIPTTEHQFLPSLQCPGKIKIPLFLRLL